MIDAKKLSKILFVDLSKKSFWVEERPQLFEKYLGGSGVGIQLLKEFCPDGIDPLDEKNPIIFTVGYLNAIYPLASKIVAMFKSPLTGNLGESHCGGRAAVSLRMAGYGALVILGKCDMPIFLVINEKGVEFRNANTLWGMRDLFTVGKIIREQVPKPGSRTIMRIGRAGEKLIPFASVTTETYRHFGRLGLGAVFGSKMLKAIVITGNETFTVADKKGYNNTYNALYQTLTQDQVMKKYHDIGTPINVMALNGIKGLPTKNASTGEFEHAAKLSGEHIAQNYLGRRTACSHCPVACIHIATFREPYENDPYFYRTKFVSYDHEPIFALGTMLGIEKTEGFLKIMDTAEIYGLDCMSLGVALAWATEAFQKGIISEKDTGGLQLKFGDVNAYIKAIDALVSQKIPFFKDLSMGAEYASLKWGGKEYAMCFGKNEMAGYQTGPIAFLGYLVGSRHSHLDGAGYSYDQKYLGKPMDMKKAAEYLFEEEAWRNVLSSSVMCFFARNVYTPEKLSECYKNLGIEKSPEQLKELGREILKEKYRFKVKQGFSLDPSKIRIPERVFEAQTSNGVIKKEEFVAALKYFIEIIEK